MAANAKIRDAVHGLYIGVVYFQNVIVFHSSRKNIILNRSLGGRKKCDLLYIDLDKTEQMLKNITGRCLVQNFVKIGQYVCEITSRNSFRPVTKLWLPLSRFQRTF
jgi:hypothetical protein